MKKRINWKILIISLIIVYAVAFIGSLFTSQGTNTEWYDSIKPSITPPNFVFPIVWNILFFLIALSLYFAWINIKKRDKKSKIKITIVFGINFILNIIWSIFFFSLQNLVIAFVILIALWISILSLIIITRKVNIISSWLLVPYLLWVTFAGILNWLIITK